jgi:hypothetical protein
MFNKILIANRGDQRRSRAAHAGDCTAVEVIHV